MRKSGDGEAEEVTRKSVVTGKRIIGQKGMQGRRNS